MTLPRLLGKTFSDFDKLGALDAFKGRRRLIFGGSLLAGAVAWPRNAKAGPPASAEHWLARRITMGATEEELTLADSLGYDAYLEYHLNPAAIDDSALDTILEAYDSLTMTPAELLDLPQNQPPSELIEAAILRSVFSKRQLFERMVEFWTDHFNIDINTGLNRLLKAVDDRDVIRAHALDTFPNLLIASAHSPAMLFYLDNYASVVGNPNENYARELMELHTLGVGGGYTQQDVVELARCLTGWTIYSQNSGANSLTYRYRAIDHDNDEKTVLGNYVAPGGGQADGDAVLNVLAYHPSTAAFISRKLCKWFYAENPPQTLVDAVAATYTSTGGDIKEMLRTLFHAVDPLAAPLKYKRPYHQFVSAMRATGAAVTATSGLRTQLSAAGHHPFSWGPPDGYPDSLDHWVGLLLPRWNFGASLLNGNVVGATVNINPFLAGATTAAQVADRIDDALFGGTMPANQKSRITQYLLPDNPTTQRKRDAVGLAIGAPAFQWY
ncbi:MAG TPA: DUF1800 domain-containing protein [Phycisphaerae bacterium]|nr:DUF1800 domain-containing protein [Phycisphaerae bacterium]